MAISHDEHAAEDTAVVYAGFASEVKILEAKISPELDCAIFIHVCGAVIQVRFTSSTSNWICVA
jgi:hypothetical protein